MDFRTRVAEHYRNRGYQVRESVRVRGSSGSIYAVDMVAQSDLGGIVVTFGGTDGIDEADLAQLKRLSKDLGATPVAASPQIDPVLRRLAQRENIVLLDSDFAKPLLDPILEPAVPEPTVEELHPWPETGRAGNPARTAKPSVALDDLMGEETPDPVDATREPRAADVLWGQKKAQATATETADTKSRFDWLRPNEVPEQGGYEFEDAEPLSRTRKPDDVASRIDAIPTPKRVAKPVVAQKVPKVQTQISPDPWWTWPLRLGLAAVVAGIVAGLIIRYLP